MAQISLDDRYRRARRALMASGGRSLAALGLSVLIGLSILISWYYLSEHRIVSRLILPTPAEVASAFHDGTIGGIWWNDILATLIEAILGLAIGALAGIVLGALFAYVDLLHRAAFPYILAIQTFPKVALAPLLMAWLGYGLSPKVIIASLLAFFPVFTNTLAGFRDVDRSMVELLRSMRASPWQELAYLRLPYALGFILPSLDVALVLALLGSIAAELAGAERGLGQVIMQRTYSGDIPAVYAVLILLAIMGIVLRALIKSTTGFFTVGSSQAKQ